MVSSSLEQNMKLKFVIYNESEKNLSCRDLYLWINVSETE